MGSRARGLTTQAKEKIHEKFLAVYVGTATALEKSEWNELPEESRKETQARGMAAWMDWGAAHSGAILDHGAPLGKTKRVAREGVADITNNLTGYVLVEAESHEDAARMFESHPHFSIFPGDSVEIMECLPVPSE